MKILRLLLLILAAVSTLSAGELERKKNLDKRYNALMEIHKVVGSETLKKDVDETAKYITLYQEEIDRKQKLAYLQLAEENLKNAEKQYARLLLQYADDIMKFFGAIKDKKLAEVVHGKPVLSHKERETVIQYHKMMNVEYHQAVKARRERNYYYGNHLFVRTLKYAVAGLKTAGTPLPENLAILAGLK